MALKFKFFFRQKKSDFEKEENEKTRSFYKQHFYEQFQAKIGNKSRGAARIFLKESTKCLKMLADKKCGFSTD